MRRALIVPFAFAFAFASFACTRPSPSPSPSTSSSSSVTVSPAPPPPLTTTTIERDLELLFAESFDPRAESSVALVARMRSAPARYHQRFDSLYVRFDRDPQRLERPLARFFLNFDAPELKPLVESTRAALAIRYDDALAGRADLPPLDEGARARLEARLADLEALTMSWPAPSPTYKPRPPTSVCIVRTRRATRMLRVTYDCLCGQPLACAVRDGRLDVRYDEHAPAMCSECYASESVCALPDAVANVDAGGGRVTLVLGDDAGTISLSSAQRCTAKK